MARPPKYNEQRATKIANAVRGGNTLTVAARIGGIDYSTLKSWRQRFPEFDAAIATAEAEAIGVYVDDLGHAARNGNVAAITFYLERRGGGEWRKPSDRLELTDHRREAEAIAAEIGKGDDPAIVGQIERDLLLGQLPTR